MDSRDARSSFITTSCSSDALVIFLISAAAARPLSMERHAIMTLAPEYRNSQTTSRLIHLLPLPVRIDAYCFCGLPTATTVHCRPTSAYWYVVLQHMMWFSGSSKTSMFEYTLAVQHCTYMAVERICRSRKLVSVCAQLLSQQQSNMSADSEYFKDTFSMVRSYWLVLHSRPEMVAVDLCHYTTGGRLAV